MEAADLTRALPSDFNISSLSRVTSQSLDPRKHWYILKKEICGIRPVDFSRNEIFKRFPDDIRSVATRELLPAKSAFVVEFNRMPSTVIVASTFGLIAGLICQKGIPPHSLINSPRFLPIVGLLNSVALDLDNDLDPDRAKGISFGGKIHQSSEELSSKLAERTAKIESLEMQIKDLQSRILEFESLMETSLNDSSFSDLSSPCCSSTPSRSCSSSCSSIEDTKTCPDLGSTTKKRLVLKRCREVNAALEDVSEKYHESIASVLGNTFLCGTTEERGKVRDTISEVIDLVMESKGTKKGLSQLLSPETLARIFESMRVPDWVLLYFKLQTRLPDSAWQTLLNLTRLGKSGVSLLAH